MKPFSKILLPVDGSPQSKTAEHMTITISKLLGSQVTIFHVVSNEILSLPQKIYTPRENIAPISTATGQFPRTIITPKPEEYLLPNSVVEEAINSLSEKAENILSEAKTLLTLEGLDVVQKRTSSPNVADAIMQEIETGQYDLIVLGNAGNEENAYDLHLGSIAAKVSSNNFASTLVVRKTTHLKTILLAIEDPIRDLKSIETAAMLTKAAGSRLLVVHVQERHLLRVFPRIKESGRQIISQTETLLDGLPNEQFLEVGDPAEVILKKAEQNKADLIMIGRGGHGGLRHLLGSVSDHVLHYATVSTLIIK